MLIAIITGVICTVLSLTSSYFYYKKVRLIDNEKQNMLVAPIADSAFLDGFEKGWEAALANPGVVKTAYIHHFMKEY